MPARGVERLRDDAVSCVSERHAEAGRCDPRCGACRGAIGIAHATIDDRCTSLVEHIDVRAHGAIEIRRFGGGARGVAVLVGICRSARSGDEDAHSRVRSLLPVALPKQHQLKRDGDDRDRQPEREEDLAEHA